MPKSSVTPNNNVTFVHVYNKPHRPKTNKNIIEKLDKILGLPKHIVNIRFSRHVTNGIEYVILRATCNGRSIKIGRVYRYVFFPTKHMNYYKHKANNLKININDYLDGIVTGKYLLCPNKGDNLYTDVEFLKDYPEFYICRDGVLYGSHQLDELIELEEFSRKRDQVPNNIYPEILGNISQHVQSMEKLYGPMDVSSNKLVEQVKPSNSESSDSKANDFKISNSQSSNNNSINQDISLNNKSLPYVDSSKINLYNGDSDLSIAYDKDDKDYISEIIYDEDYLEQLSSTKHSFLTHSLVGVTNVNIDKILAEQPGPKTDGIVPLNPIVTKNFYSSLLMDHFFKESGLAQDVATALDISGAVHKDEIDHYVKLIFSLCTVNVIQQSLIYKGGIETQMLYPLGLDIHLNDSQFIKTMRVIGNEAFLNALNQCRYNRLGPEEGLFCDRTSIKHECNNNDYSTLMFSSDKRFINGVSSTIAISDRTHIPALFKIYPGNFSDFTIGGHLLSLFSIEDKDKKISSIVVDRGYASRNNLYLASESGINLITASRRNDGIRNKLIEKHAIKMLKRTFNYRSSKHSNLLTTTELVDMEVANPNNPQEMISFPVYAHIICNTKTRQIEQEKFDLAIVIAKEKIAECKSIDELNKLLKKSTKIRKIIKEYDNNPTHVDKGKINVIALFNDRYNLGLDEDKIERDLDTLGFMVNYSTKEITADKCYRYYVNRNFIEGYNKHSKTTLDSGTGRSHDTDTYLGRQIITFITSILTTSIKAAMSGIHYDEQGNQLPVNETFSNKFSTIKELLAQLNSSKLLINLTDQEWKLQDLNKSLTKYLEYLGINNIHQQSKEYLEEIIKNEIKVSITLQKRTNSITYKNK